jgi:hypothetical protein
MVPIEEAATEFGLRSSEVVDRIQGLESMGRLTGGLGFKNGWG